MINSIANFERLLNHKCDIYHYQAKEVSKGYGLSSIQDGYPDTPDIKSINCHFHAETLNVAQGEPHQDITARRKVDFPIGTDIRLNDKVVYEGISYYAELPVNVREHHISVYLQRKGKDSYGENRS